MTYTRDAFTPVVDAKLLCACRLAYVDPGGSLRSDADKDPAFPFPFGVEDGEAFRRESPDWPQDWQRWETVDGKDAAILGVCSLGIIVAFRGTLSPIYVPGVGLPRPRERSEVRPEHLRAPLFMQALGALFAGSLQAIVPSPLRALQAVFRFVLSSQGFFESLYDWLNNADLQLTPWQEHGPGDCAALRPEVHSGWKRSFEDLWNQGLRDGLERALEKKKEIFVTGHSKGGALAFLAAKRMQDDRKDAQLCVRTFAAPKPGDELFAEEYNRTITDTVCYEYGADIVPHVPPRREATKEVFTTLLATSSLGHWLWLKLSRRISGQPAFPTECDRYRHVGKRVYIPYFTLACTPALDARGHGERSKVIEQGIDLVWLETVKEMLRVSPLAFLLIAFDHAFSGKSGYASYIFSMAAAAESAR